MASKNRLSDFTMDFAEVAPTIFEKTTNRDTEAGVKVLANTTEYKMRRIQSELALEHELPWHWEQGVSYHCISSGDADGLSYFRAAVKQQKIHYALLSTFSLSTEDVRELRHWVKRGYIGRIDVYVGKTFLLAKKALEWRELESLCRESGGRLCFCRTHAKVFALFGENFDCVIAGSANINTNRNVEEVIITVNSEVAKFYKDFFDELKSEERSFDEVRPWQPES